MSTHGTAASEEVLFSHGVSSTDGRSERPNSSSQTERKDVQMQPRTTVSTAGTGIGERSGSSTYAVTEKKKKEYKEPWVRYSSTLFSKHIANSLHAKCYSFNIIAGLQ